MYGCLVNEAAVFLKKGVKIMIKKVFLFIFILGIFFPNHVFANEKILGIEKNVWQEDLQRDFSEYSFDDKFLTKIQEEEKILKQKRSANYFEELNSKHQSPKEKRKKNPLLNKNNKVKSKFIVDLDLDKNEYVQLLSTIPRLEKTYYNDEVAKFFPYIALCLNSDIKISEINYYLKHFSLRGVPVDIATERLYKIANEK